MLITSSYPVYCGIEKKKEVMMKEKILFIALLVGLLLSISIVGAAIHNGSDGNALLPSLNAMPKNVRCICIYILGTDDGTILHNCGMQDTNCVEVICPC